MAKQKTIGSPYPALTLVIIGISLVVTGFPQLSGLLVYDRRAILDGELWRLFTAPFVHFSESHLWWDLLVFGTAGWVIERAGYRSFAIVCVFAAVLPGLFLLATAPDLTLYGGLSGLAVGAVVYLCLNKAGETGRNRGLWVVMLLIVLVKIAVEARLNTTLFVHTDGISFRVLPSVHVIGFISALTGLLWTRYVKETLRRFIAEASCPLTTSSSEGRRNQ